MTKLLEHAVESVRALPPEVQDELARLLLQVAGASGNGYMSFDQIAAFQNFVVMPLTVGVAESTSKAPVAEPRFPARLRTEAVKLWWP